MDLILVGTVALSSYIDVTPAPASEESVAREVPKESDIEVEVGRDSSVPVVLSSPIGSDLGLPDSLGLKSDLSLALD